MSATKNMNNPLLEQESITYLRTMTSAEFDFYSVGIDVGGTNTRLAVTFRQQGQFTEPFTLLKFQANTVKDLLAGLTEAGREIFHILGRRSASACIAAAGRKLDNDNAVQLTNYQGSPDERILRKVVLPCSIFPPQNISFLNDLESASYGIIALHLQGKLQEYFKALWPTEAPVVIQSSPSLVIAGGTGLGVALLHLTKMSPNYEVLPLEFGHIQLSNLSSAETDFEQDRSLREFLSNKLYSGEFQPETEDIVSGRGIAYALEFLTGEKGVDTALIAQRAATGDKNALTALSIHYRWMTRIAQTLGVGFVAKSIFLSGDNQVHNFPFVEQNQEELQQLFLRHPKKAWLDNVPVFVQSKLLNINLLGALYFAQTFGRF